MIDDDFGKSIRTKVIVIAAKIVNKPMIINAQSRRVAFFFSCLSSFRFLLENR